MNMNRYPLWKYLVLGAALLIGLIYTLPNFFGEAPAVQVSSARATVKVTPDVQARVEAALQAAKIPADFVQLEGSSVRARFANTDVQLKAKDAISGALNRDAANPDFIVALNLLSRSPQWLSQLHAFPMYLGLDLRGGVHFLMEVDMKVGHDQEAPRRWSATCAACCATRTSVTPASPATATASPCCSATPRRAARRCATC
jgi:preprotein translocase subunit SecD